MMALVDCIVEQLSIGCCSQFHSLWYCFASLAS